MKPIESTPAVDANAGEPAAAKLQRRVFGSALPS